MGLTIDKLTGAYNIDINYKRQEGGANFYIPEPITQTSHLTFDKAKSFGFKITMPYDFIYESDGEILDLGISIELPPRTAFLILSLDKRFEDYVIDNGEPGRFNPLKLYCKKGNDNTKEFKKGQPILWVLPIPDMAYSYQYRNKGLDNG